MTKWATTKWATTKWATTEWATTEWATTKWATTGRATTGWTTTAPASRPRRALLLATALLSLAACSHTQQTALQARCERQADNDPLVHQLMVDRMTGDIRNDALKPRYDSARKQAYNRCLISNGQAPRGGVQAVEPDT